MGNKDGMMKDKIRIFCNIIVQLNTILEKPQKKRFIRMFFLFFVIAFLEMLGVTAIIPFISALLDVDKLMDNRYLRDLIHVINIQDLNKVLLLIGAMLILVYFVKNISLLIVRGIQNVYQYKIQQELSTKMLKFYMRRPYEFFVNTNSTEIYKGINGDVLGIHEVIRDLLVIISELIVTAFIMFSIFIINIGISIGLLLSSFVCVMVILLGCRKFVRLAGIKVREADIEKTKYAFQSINGIKEIFVLQRQDFFIKEYDKAYELYRKNISCYMFVNLIPERLIEMILASGIILFVCLQNVLGYDSINYVSQLAAVALACFRMLPSINKIVTGVNDMIYRMPEVQAVYMNILEVKKQEAEKDNQEEMFTVEQLSFEKELIMKDISWHYANSDRNILEQVSLHIRKGESVALIGESGAGKSTLADIIMGLLHPQEGKILLDEIDISKLEKQRSRLIGYVPQNVYLIDDTIRNNVAFGIEQQDIRDEDVWRALEEAELSQFVKGLPNKLDTIVGERGIKFSGGQRQRIAIARTLYYNPEILVLDEATSALDSETEKAVMDSINSLMGVKTLIIVAHRLSTIQNCDTIYEIKDGKVFKKSKKDE